MRFWQPENAPVPGAYRGASLTRKRTPLGPYCRHMLRVLGGVRGERFPMSEVPLFVSASGGWSDLPVGCVSCVVRKRPPPVSYLLEPHSKMPALEFLIVKKRRKISAFAVLRVETSHLKNAWFLIWTVLCERGTPLHVVGYPRTGVPRPYENAHPSRIPLGP